jgi:hypothetical protein
MWKQLWSLSLQSSDIVNIFVLALFVLLAKVAVKYITKLPVICNENPSPGAKKAAHFDCLRLGIDLTFVGLVAGLAVIRLALKHTQQPDIYGIASFQGPFLLLQFVLILSAAIFTTVFGSPEKSFGKGIFVPLIFGIASLYCTIATFMVVSR